MSSQWHSISVIHIWYSGSAMDYISQQWWMRNRGRGCRLASAAAVCVDSYALYELQQHSLQLAHSGLPWWIATATALGLLIWICRLVLVLISIMASLLTKPNKRTNENLKYPLRLLHMNFLGWCWAWYYSLPFIQYCGGGGGLFFFSFFF
jgi:hypothetical protein